MDSTTNQKIMQEAKFLKSYEKSILELKEVSDEKITFDRELRDGIKRREQEQIQELLISLTDELFEKIEKINLKKKSNAMKTTKKNQNLRKKTSPNEESKIIFTDLSWYRKKLASNGEKNQ